MLPIDKLNKYQRILPRCSTCHEKKPSLDAIHCSKLAKWQKNKLPLVLEVSWRDLAQPWRHRVAMRDEQLILIIHLDRNDIDVEALVVQRFYASSWPPLSLITSMIDFDLLKLCTLGRDHRLLQGAKGQHIFNFVLGLLPIWIDFTIWCVIDGSHYSEMPSTWVELWYGCALHASPKVYDV